MTESAADSTTARGIEAAGVRRTFDDVVAVDSIDLNAPAGQVTALVGPNGAGKTTLLLMLASLLEPDSGTIRVAGFNPVAEPAEVRARMGWMPDSFGSYDTLTALEVLEFTGAAYRLPRERAASRAAELLALVHLDEFARRPVHVLSRGQKQRLGLARALVHDPSVLMLDEPAAGLDPRSRIELRTLLRRLADDGKAILVSSHILADLEATADRVVFVDKGRTIRDQSLTELQGEESRPWRLRALDTAALVAALDERDVDHSPPDANGVEVLLSGDAAAAELLAGLVGAGVAVVACAPVGSTLEAAYLEITNAERR